NAQRLNALTRLLLLIVLGMYIFGYDKYITTLVLGLMLILILRGNNRISQENFKSDISETQALDSGIRGFIPGLDSKPKVGACQSCWFDQDTSLRNMAFEVTPPIQFNLDDSSKRSYMNAKYELTPLQPADGFTQIWRTEPDMC